MNAALQRDTSLPQPLQGLLHLGAGDSAVYVDVLPAELAEQAFAALEAEVPFGEMRNRGHPVPRLVSVQGSQTAETEPVYRHPADEQPALIGWTPMADRLRQAVAAALGIELNHALIQLYRDGSNAISEHADKSLDIRRGTSVIGLSLGATRRLIMRTKDKAGGRRVLRLMLPHNSVFVLGWETNRGWTHQIKADGRPDALKRPDELRQGGARISLTMRDIATFVRRRDGRLFGQGARCKTEAELEQGGEEKEMEGGVEGVDEEEEEMRLLKAFSDENHQSDFDWDAAYGQGFSVLNFKTINSGREEGEGGGGGGGLGAGAE